MHWLQSKVCFLKTKKSGSKLARYSNDQHWVFRARVSSCLLWGIHLTQISKQAISTFRSDSLLFLATHYLRCVLDIFTTSILTTTLEVARRGTRPRKKVEERSTGAGSSGRPGLWAGLHPQRGPPGEHTLYSLPSGVPSPSEGCLWAKLLPSHPPGQGPFGQN